MKKVMFLLALIMMISSSLFAQAYLIVESITTNPVTPDLYSEVIVSVKIKNIGNQTSEKSSIFMTISPKYKFSTAIVRALNFGTVSISI